MAPEGGGKLLAIGFARAKGIQMPGRSGLLGLTAFEAAAGSKAHRPNEFTFASVSHSLQARVLQNARSMCEVAGSRQHVREKIVRGKLILYMPW